MAAGGQGDGPSLHSSTSWRASRWASSPCSQASSHLLLTPHVHVCERACGCAVCLHVCTWVHTCVAGSVHAYVWMCAQACPQASSGLTSDCGDLRPAQFSSPCASYGWESLGFSLCPPFSCSFPAPGHAQGLASQHQSSLAWGTD